MRYFISLLRYCLVFGAAVLPFVTVAQTTADSTHISYTEEVVNQPLVVDTMALRVQREDRALWKIGLNNFTVGYYKRFGVHIIYERKVGRPAWSVMGEVSPSYLHYAGNHLTVRTQLAGRYYYNLERRIRQGRNAGNFSANYLSVALGAGIGHFSDMPFYLYPINGRWVCGQAALLYGVQRRLGHHGFFDVNIGLARMLTDEGGLRQQTTGSLRVGFLLEGSTASRAYAPQPTDGILLPRWYVGAQAGVYGYKVRYDEVKVAFSNWVVPYVYAGYYLQPRLAVQLGVQASHRHTNSNYYVLDNSRYRYDTDEYMAAVPMLLHYALTKLAQQRTQVGVIAGASLVVAQARYQQQYYDLYGQQTAVRNGRDYGFGVNPMVGMDLAYGFGRTRRIQAVAEAVLIKPLSIDYYYGTALGASAGLRYRFAYKDLSK